MPQSQDTRTLVKLWAIYVVNFVLITCVFQFLLPHIPGVVYQGNLLIAVGFALLSQAGCLVFAMVCAALFTFFGVARAAFGQGNPIVVLGEATMQYADFAARHQMSLSLVLPLVPKILVLKLLDLYLPSVIHFNSTYAFICSALAVHAVAVVMYFIGQPMAPPDAEI
jgi:hypothetical protein